MRWDWFVNYFPCRTLYFTVSFSGNHLRYIFSAKTEEGRQICCDCNEFPGKLSYYYLDVCPLQHMHYIHTCYKLFAISYNLESSFFFLGLLFIRECSFGHLLLGLYKRSNKFQ